jgi:hypothetical protein
MILPFYKDQSPVVILKDVKFEDMSALIQFMYNGEINIEQVGASVFRSSFLCPLVVCLNIPSYSDFLGI